MASRRLSSSQITRLIEGCEIVSEVTGLSVSEIVSVLLGAPNEEPDEGRFSEPQPIKKAQEA